MADGELPAKPSALMRNIFGGTVVFCFFLVTVDDLNDARYEPAAIWGALFVVALVLLLAWDRIFHQIAEEQAALPRNLHNVPVPKPFQPLALDFSQSAASYDPRTDLRKILLTEAWRLNFNPSHPEGQKEISFLHDGRIGVGANSNESRWQILNDTLRIFRETGQLQNDFKFDAEHNKFVSTNNSFAKGIKDQVIYKIESAAGPIIPLNKAAEQAYVALEGTAFGNEIEGAVGFLAARVGARGGKIKTTEEILRTVMLNMSKHGEVTGVKWPSGKRQLIPNMQSFKIYPDENCLRYDHEDKPLYTELATTQAVIDEFVRYGKSVSGPV